MNPEESYTVFAGSERVTTGDLAQVAQSVKSLLNTEESHSVLVFNDTTGAQVDIDLRGDISALLARDAKPAPEPGPAPSGPRGPGRPKLGVVGREITLLPRHWEWLNVQPGGASVALRKLVEQARRQGKRQDEVRQSREAAYRFMSAIAGNLAGFEEASRALFAGQEAAFATQIGDWPGDIRSFARRLAAGSFTIREES